MASNWEVHPYLKYRSWPFDKMQTLLFKGHVTQCFGKQIVDDWQHSCHNCHSCVYSRLSSEFRGRWLVNDLDFHDGLCRVPKINRACDGHLSVRTHHGELVKNKWGNRLHIPCGDVAWASCVRSENREWCKKKEEFEMKINLKCIIITIGISNLKKIKFKSTRKALSIRDSILTIKDFGSFSILTFSNLKICNL